MARGEYCAKHGRYFGNVVPCADCENERYRAQFDSLAIADGWSDPVGRAMKPLMESTLQDLVSSGPADKEYLRLRAIEAAARELCAANDAIAAEGPLGSQWPGPLMWRHKEALTALRAALNSSP